jgi:hypothetical protein
MSIVLILVYVGLSTELSIGENMEELHQRESVLLWDKQQPS